MNEEQEQELFEYLKQNLRLNLKSTSEYTGGLDGSGSLYKDSHTIQLVLEGEVISEEYLS
jgi:hypothetical protein